MSPALGLTLFFAGYALLLGGIALIAERTGILGRSRGLRRAVYVLGLGAYCTSWTFYGSVGAAVSGRWVFLTIYLGATLGAIFWPRLLGRMIAIRDRYHAVSVADLISARYGKSRRLGVLVTLSVVLAIVPYLALQIRALHDSGLLILGDRQAGLGTSFEWAILVCLILFSAGFGVRHLRSTEPNDGLVATIAFESVVKLVAFVAVGIYATFVLHDGFGDVLAAARAVVPEPPQDTFPTWVSYTLLSAWAILFLPRQFHMAVVENRDPDFVRTAAVWVPAFLLLMNVFVVPVAGAGLALGLPAAEADAYVLSIPLAGGADALAWLVFVGGISAATGMVTLGSVTVGTMVCHHLVLPALARAPGLGFLSRRVLLLRRLAVAAILIAGYGFELTLGNESSLVSIGMLAFAATAQLAPAILAALFWPSSSRAGATIGLSLGFGVWLYTLFLPALADVHVLSANWVSDGLFGAGWLRPRALFGLTGLDPISHALFWSIGLNTLGLVLGSAWRPPDRVQRRESEGFGTLRLDVEEARAMGFDPGPTDIPLGPKLESLRRASLRWVGVSTYERMIDAVLARSGLASDQPVGIEQLRALRAEFEAELASVVGVALAHASLQASGFFGAEEQERLAAHYARTMAELDVGPDELRRRLEDHRVENERALEQASWLEAVVAERTAALEAANQGLEAAREAAEAASRAKTDFLCAMSHEIRTPLTAILGSVTLALEGEMEGPPLRGHLEAVETNGEHLLAILDDILDLSKVESGQLTVERVPTNPADIVRDVVELLRARAEEKRLQLELHIDGSLPPAILSDPTRLRQILLNLVSNAVKFTEAGGVKVRASAAGTTLRFEVEDTGVGLSAEQQARLFEPFEQGVRRRLHGGIGLGLSISKRLAERLGGRLAVSSIEGMGSTFSLELLRVERAKTTELPEPEVETSPGGSLLLVEDNVVNQRIAMAMLTKMGHRVDLAENGSEGLEQALSAWREGRPYDLVLMDMNMPVMDGYEAVERLRAAGYSGAIAALTAHAMDAERDRCLALGCDDFSTKPYRRAELQTMVAHFVEAARR